MGGLFFVGACSRCHRATEIAIQKLGRKIQCQHCGSVFTATDPHSQSAALDDPMDYWTRFTDHGFSNENQIFFQNRDITRTPK
jgi:hypothetical protein